MNRVKEFAVHVRLRESACPTSICRVDVSQRMLGLEILKPSSIASVRSKFRPPDRGRLYISTDSMNQKWCSAIFKNRSQKTYWTHDPFSLGPLLCEKLSCLLLPRPDDANTVPPRGPYDEELMPPTNSNKKARMSLAADPSASQDFSRLQSGWKTVYNLMLTPEPDQPSKSQTLQ